MDIVFYPASAAGLNISAPATTASSLFTLLNTALAGTTARFITPPNAIDIKPEDGDIRVTFGAEVTATPLLGRLIKQGEIYSARNRPVANMKIVSTGSAAVKCSVEIGIASPGERDYYSGGGSANNRYNASPATRAEGEGGPGQTNNLGGLLTDLQTTLFGEDQNLNVLRAIPKWNKTRITTATTTLIKSGAGVFGGIVLGKDVATNVTDAYDAVTATGTPTYKQTTGAALLSDPGRSTGPLGEFSTGLTIVTSQAVDITVLWL